MMVGVRLNRLRMRLGQPGELWIQSLRDLDLSRIAGQALVHLCVAAEAPAYTVLAIAHV